MELVTDSHSAKMDLLYTVFFIDVCSIFVFPVTYSRILLNERTNSRQFYFELDLEEKANPWKLLKLGIFSLLFF